MPCPVWSYARPASGHVAAMQRQVGKSGALHGCAHGSAGDPVAGILPVRTNPPRQGGAPWATAGIGPNCLPVRFGGEWAVPGYDRADDIPLPHPEQSGPRRHGSVYVAEDTHLGRRVAVKFSTASPEIRSFARVFLGRPRGIGAQPSAYRGIYDYGRPRRAPLHLMELVSGEDLFHVLRGARCRWRKRCASSGRCGGTGEAHARNRPPATSSLPTSCNAVRNRNCAAGLYHAGQV